MGSPDEKKLNILILGTMIDTAPLGQEMTINLAKHLLAGYTQQEPPFVNLFKRSVIHLMPFTKLTSNILLQYQMEQKLCDPIVNDEFIDKILSPENDKTKNIFLNMLQTKQFDLILTFSAGGYELQYPHNVTDHTIYDHMADIMRNQRLREIRKQCSTTPSRIHQTNMIEKITDFFLEYYKVPLFTLQLNCCKMPPQEQIAQIWRRNIFKILNFFKLTESGVEGMIKKRENMPLRNAIVSIKGTTITKAVTKNLAYFRFVLPEGEYELEIIIDQKRSHTIPINIQKRQILNLGEILLNNTNANVTENMNRKIENDDISTINFGGVISGYVLDETNRAIAGAKIALINTKRIISNVSDLNGAYMLNGMPLGEITLDVNAAGHVEGQKYTFFIYFSS